MKYFVAFTLIFVFNLCLYAQKRQCFCAEVPAMNKATASCEPIKLKNKSKLYWQYNCKRIWLTLETARRRKIVLDEIPPDLFGYTYRLGYHLIKEFKRSLLFRGGCPANGPCIYTLINKNNGKVIRRFRQLINIDTDISRENPHPYSFNFVVYFSQDYKKVKIYFIDLNKTLTVPFLGFKKISDAVIPEHKFERMTLKQNLLSLFYETDDKKKWVFQVNLKNRKQISDKEIEPKEKQISIEKRLKYYFIGREIKPAIIINNLERMVPEEAEKIKIGNHEIVWHHLSDETKIEIDNDIFSLEGEKTLNFVDEKQNDDVDFANNWDQIQLFKFGDRELIGISMFPEPCTGIGCRVTMYLIYDLKTKTKNFFGTYRFLLERDFGLFDFENDGSIDFLSSTYDDGNNGEGIEFANVYEVFTMNENGKFQIRLDKKEQPYFMKRVYKEEDYEEVDCKFEENWVEEIK